MEVVGDQSLYRNIEKGKLDKIEEIIGQSEYVTNFGQKRTEKIDRRSIYRIELNKIKDYVQYLPFLPDGFGFTGGVARSALLGMLGDKIPKIRDFDIEGISGIPGEDNPTNEDAVIVAQEHMKDDYIQSARINPSLKNYFETRDFTINEVFLIGNLLYYSKGALLDAENKVVRPTQFEKQRYYKTYDNEYEEFIYQTGKISPKVLLRALLFQVELIKLYGNAKAEEIESYEMCIENFPPFYLAKSIEKASSKRVAMEFYRMLFDNIHISEEIIPEGKTRDGLRRLAGLAKHWMLMRDDEREVEYSDKFFNQPYSLEQERKDDKEFEEWYQKSLSRTVKFSKIRPQDLE